MNPDDEPKMAFTTGEVVYYYVCMPFRLKNGGCTFQRLMNDVFTHRLSRNVEDYIDDATIKSMTLDDHLVDLEETSRTLQRYKLQLKQKKCSFFVRACKFLGYMISESAINANLKKVKAITDMP